jgi:hypothetical protein
MWRWVTVLGLALAATEAAVPEDGANGSATSLEARLLALGGGGKGRDAEPADRAIFGTMKELLLGSLGKIGVRSDAAAMGDDSPARGDGAAGRLSGNRAVRGSGGIRGGSGDDEGSHASRARADGGSGGGDDRTDPRKRGDEGHGDSDGGSSATGSRGRSSSGSTSSRSRSRAEQSLKAQRHKAAYRSQCYLRTDSRRFGVAPPANYARSDEARLLYFEVIFVFCEEKRHHLLVVRLPYDSEVSENTLPTSFIMH